MNAYSTDTPTITLTPEGVAATPGPLGQALLVRVSTGDLQNFNRALRRYEGSDNQLINASADLLAVCGVLNRLAPGQELNTTRTELSRAIIDLKYRIVRLDYPPSVAENLCLLFAIALDEFVMVSPWGSESGWENRTLVADLFGFRDGGDRFYNIADRALMQPKALREFLEIIHIFLKLGYRGKYTRGTEHERDRLLDRLETALSLVPQPEEIKPVGRPVRDTRAPGWRVPARHKIAATVAAIALIWLGSWGLRSQMERTIHAGFTDRRVLAESESAVDFVFDSDSGTVVTRPRQ